MLLWWHRVGQRVAPVDGLRGWCLTDADDNVLETFGEGHPRSDEAFTIARVDLWPDDSSVGIALAELGRPDLLYDAAYFRPLSDISSLRKIAADITKSCEHAA